MKLSHIISESVIDNERGAGATPNNANVDYAGVRVMMRPSVFLQLAFPLDDRSNVAGMVEYIKGGGKIGSPTLYVDVAESWEDGDLRSPAQVTGHEGRHRMLALQEIHGDAPVEVHIFVRYYRARNITPEWLSKLQSGMYSQTKSFVRGPLFT